MTLLAHIMRGNLSESRHTGYISIANSAGEVLFSSGPSQEDPISYYRSSAKPLQAIPLVESGAADFFKLTEEELALACSSHNGEPEHVRVVMGMQAKAGLSPENLLCGPDYPIFEGAREALIVSQQPPNPLYNNCSGKHTGMLMVCKYMGWPLENYTDASHPLQQAILQVVADFCGLPADEIYTGIDGCSVVCFGVSTARMATSFARLSDPDYWEKAGNHTRAAAVQRITTAMQTYPFMVAGTGRNDTDLMNSLKDSKIFSKGGAEAVWCAGFVGRGLGIAFKIEDGGNRAQSLIMGEALRQSHLVSEEEINAFLASQVKPLVNKRGLQVGEYLAAFTLRPPSEW